VYLVRSYYAEKQGVQALQHDVRAHPGNDVTAACRHIQTMSRRWISYEITIP